MKSQFWILRGLLACVFLLSHTAAQCANFVDVLDTPAARSALAAHALINGVTTAGQRLVAVGQRGHIVYSDDLGKSWLQAKVPVSSDLVAVQFPTPQQGWAVGHDGIVLHTSDAGISWIKQLDGRAAAGIMNSYYSSAEFSDALRGEATRMAEQGPDKPFLDLWFDSDKSGFVVGAFNLIFHTDDGGLHWQPWLDRTDNPQAYHFNAIRAIGDALYITGEHGLLLKKAKGSERFVALTTPYQGSYFGLIGSNNAGNKQSNSAVIVYGLRGNAYRSTDQGSSWQKIETGLPLGLTAATQLPDGRLVLLSQAGHVLISNDGGASFKLDKQAKPGPAFTVAAIGKQTLIIGGLRGVRLQTLDLP